MLKFHLNKVYNYTKGKSTFELIALAISYGFLAPLAISGILMLSLALITGEANIPNSFGIYG